MQNKQDLLPLGHYTYYKVNKAYYDSLNHN